MTAKPQMPHVTGSTNGVAADAEQGAADLVAASPAAPEIYELLAGLRRDIDARRTGQAGDHASDAEDDIYAMMSELRRDMSVLKRSPASMAPVKPSRPLSKTNAMASRMASSAMETATAAPDALDRNVSQSTAAKSSVVSQLTSDEWRPMLSLAAALIVAVGGLYLLTNRNALPPADGKTASAATVTASDRMIGAPPPLGPSATPVFDALSAGMMSPQGVSAKGMTATRALARAHAQLMVSGSARDTQEASFWLKRYATDALGDVRMARALTQLGGTYAEPAGKPADFNKARQVWEMASALGDPVAMCFLGRLFENGWSVSADSAKALQWYGRARDAGGCPGLDESMARVQ